MWAVVPIATSAVSPSPSRHWPTRADDGQYRYSSMLDWPLLFWVTAAGSRNGTAEQDAVTMRPVALNSTWAFLTCHVSRSSREMTRGNPLEPKEWIGDVSPPTAILQETWERWNCTRTWCSVQ